MGHEPPAAPASSGAVPWGSRPAHHPEMAGRIATAIEQRLRVVLEVAEKVLEAYPNRSTQRVF